METGPVYKSGPHGSPGTEAADEDETMAGGPEELLSETISTQGSYGAGAAAGPAFDRAVGPIGVALGELLSEHMPAQGLSGFSALVALHLA